MYVYFELIIKQQRSPSINVTATKSQLVQNLLLLFFFFVKETLTTR